MKGEINHMLVEIESYFGDRLISGKKCTENQLREKYMQAIKIADASNFTELFCRMFSFEEYPLSDDVQVDFVMDLDTNIVYAPQYGTGGVRFVSRKGGRERMSSELLDNLDKFHTTELGVLRIKRNLSLDTPDVVDWCRQRVLSAKADDIKRRGKNWYVRSDGCTITINDHSYTIITAHKEKQVTAND